MKIYLAGRVPKGKEEAENSKNFTDSIIPHIKLKNVEFIKGEKKDLDESDFLLVFGWGCSHIKNSDIVIVDARERMGVGTAQEMLIAKYFGKPVITLLPKNTYHRKPNLEFNGKNIADWIHPFIYSTSDIIVESEKDLESAIAKVTKKEIKIKDISIIEDSIKYINEKLG